ncbi:bifunctional [glutamine synthetase] adenylyltransferase/[glutamine synthetase]-adenylyl-L-tyrosine phosphorylase [Ornithinimicrobium cryptoxanthini]|uniref:Bifunctional glutamine synthetase adenylyltransferase/adenylyl-removing enzyme n=1 Tax=Ornithinimicrobium cryptoxanthini TaxID=2934161 RepID=A0ABY4YEN6_9MICO|nr:bifunctional [glutamine synthetase] adenylyltransferase/[glutamine synthetase]-adenylyl-L-tyrosine phosphorylase [Ornithinimicrobium cryptoxanthini]USQ75030.1 bifunctional [glutamine synthetase] adenylyltransferase/[glutamine synthetase]-adenylyl-L-tyrosine phosphorylase [Ornithinimicrobium cryptoxanthini]
MTTARQPLPAHLSRAGFTDARRAERLLDELLASMPGDPDAEDLTDALSRVADPDEALLGAVRLVEADPEVGLVLHEAGTARDRVLAVLGGSTALADHLVRHPEHVAVLAQTHPFGRGRALPEPGELTDRLVRAVEGLTDREGMDALRVAYRRELLLIAAADLVSEDPVELLPDVAAALADLACAALEAAVVLARAQTEGQEHCRFSVIGMGKTGGRELNYISDVDVVFLVGPAGEGDDEALAVGSRLATAVMRICSQSTGEGALWQVDAALRPEGKNGPLVRSLESHRGYYQRWASTWEFQALLKARHAAGDEELSREWLDLVQPMVWEASAREGFVENVQSMRRRVEEHVPPAEAPWQLKLGPGGLRDIEFSVQLLQLVHGRTDEELHSGTTLEALTALRDGGYVGRDDAGDLDAAYRFLRVLEHRIQLHRLRRTHLMPSTEADQRRLGRSLGERRDAAASLVQRWRAQQREVRRLHERLFYRPLLAAVAKLTSDEVRLSPEAARVRLSALGFRDPAGAMRHLESLTDGVSRRATIQRHLLPVMLGWFADGADPDAGLLAFRRISDTLGTTHWYLKMLRDEGSAAERLAHVLATSRYAVELLIKAPESVSLLGEATGLRPVSREALGARMLAAAERHDDPQDAFTGIRSVRAKELLRLVLADLVGEIDQPALRSALTELTDELLAAALGVATRAVVGDGQPAASMLIVGVGRLGGRELGYASDADLMFVYEPLEGAEGAAEQASEIIAALRKGLSGNGPDPTLELDASLRPEGKSGPLVRSFESYSVYYQRWSAGWESQALLRARPLAGDDDLAQRFTDLIQPLRWPDDGIDQAAVRDIRRLKARMEGERLPRGADPRTHFKLGLGGLTDVEWVVQLTQLQHAHEHDGLRTTGTLAALNAAVEASLISEEDASVLRRSWTLASRLRDAGVLWRGRPVESVPSDSREAEGVSRILGRPPGHGSELAEEWRRTARRCRHVVEQLLYGGPLHGTATGRLPGSGARPS